MSQISHDYIQFYFPVISRPVIVICVVQADCWHADEQEPADFMNQLTANYPALAD